MKKNIIQKTLYVCLVLFVINIISCETDYFEPEPDNIITSNDINFQVTFDRDLEKTIYPSIILGTSNYLNSKNRNIELFEYSMINPNLNGELKVVLSQTNINHETVFQESLYENCQYYSFFPSINWDYEYLKYLNQSGTIDLPFKIYIDGQIIDNKNLRLNYRSVNECVYGIIKEDGSYIDMNWMFAAYVNEEHPKIDLLLSEVLQNNFINAFIGYQGDTYDVLEQIWAIWYTLQLKNVKYSSITNTSNPSQKIFSQHVRFFEEVYNNSQANCVDGSVFLSSILKKIGIYPFLILIPGHMYMGFFGDSNKSSIYLLETTAIGEVNYNEIYEDATYVYNLGKYRHLISDDIYEKYFDGLCALEDVKINISRNSFGYAVIHNVEKYNGYLSKINDPSNHEYQVLDIEKLRKIVQPIGR